MPGLLQAIIAFFQRLPAAFPGVPASMLLFFAIFAGFIVIFLVLFLLRLVWTLLAVIFGVRRRRKRRQQIDPHWQRQARLHRLREQHRRRQADYW